MEEMEQTAPAWETEFFARDLSRTVNFAKLRCKPRQDVLKGVLDTDGEEMDAYVFRLKELRLSTPEFELLTEAMIRLADATARATPAERSRVDKLLLRLVYLLPSELATRFAEPYLDHLRKTRRKWAYATFRGKPLSPEAALKLATVFRKTGDKAALPFVIASPEAVRLLGPEFLLQKLSANEQDYWRGRLLQTLLSYDRDSAVALSQKYPVEFLHAVGRTEDGSLLPAIRSLFDSHRRDFKFLGMYAWAGKTQSFRRTGTNGAGLEK